MRCLTLIDHVYRYHDIMDPHSRNSAREALNRRLTVHTADLREAERLEGLDWYRRAIQRDIRRTLRAIHNTTLPKR